MEGRESLHLDNWPGCSRGCALPGRRVAGKHAHGPCGDVELNLGHFIVVNRDLCSTQEKYHSRHLVVHLSSTDTLVRICDLWEHSNHEGSFLFNSYRLH
jgi:hypothetical protein